MKLSKKIILIIMLTFLVLACLLSAISDIILLSGYRELEGKGIVQDTLRVRNLIEESISQLEMTAQAVANNLKRSAGQLQAFEKALDAHDMKLHRIDIASLYDANGAVVKTLHYDCDAEQLKTVTAELQRNINSISSSFIKHNKSSVKGIVLLNELPFMVAIQRVVLDNGSYGGTIVIGCFLDASELKRIFRLSGSVVDVLKLNGDVLPLDVRIANEALFTSGSVYPRVLDETHAAGYFHLTDTGGHASYVVRVTEERGLLAKGRKSIVTLLVMFFFCAAVFCGVILMFIRRSVLDRLATLSKSVFSITGSSNVSARLTVDGDDELSGLAHSINGMLDALEESERALRESEERYRALFERAPDAIIIIGMDGDETGRIVAVNQAAADQHGYTIAELNNMPISQLNTPETNQSAMGEMFDLLGQGEWVVKELWHQRKDGTRFPLEVHAGMIRIKGHRYVLGFDRDITMRKMTEESDRMYLDQIRQLNHELNRHAADLAAANNELEAFNYSVSHDMRGPLTRISGYCQLLLDEFDTLDQQAKTYVTRMYESSVWLNDMIDAMLALAQLTRSEFVLTQVDLSKIVADVLRELAMVSVDRHVTTTVVPDIIVAGDARLLKIMVTNLLNNAWKYSSNVPEAYIEFGVLESGGIPVYFVRDNGAGFNMNDAGKLFWVFTRLHDPSIYSGNGIGLATVQRIVARHSGKIWADSEPGKGATFYFTLQAEPASQESS